MFYLILKKEALMAIPNNIDACCRAAKYSVSLIFYLQDLICFLHSMQMKWHKNEMSYCIWMSTTHVLSQNVHLRFLGSATDSGQM